MGPSAFRIAGLGEQLRALGHAVTDKGNIATPVRETLPLPDTHKKYVDEIAAVCRALHDASLASFHDGALPLVLGGDHSLGAGSVTASATWLRTTTSRPLGLIWVDAHGDMNTPGNDDQRERPRDAAGVTPWPGAGRAHRIRFPTRSQPGAHMYCSASVTSTNAKNQRSGRRACTSSP
jgi:hypothetical protein